MAAHDSETHVDVNGGAAIGSAVFLGTLGVLSFIIQPAIVQGFVDHLGASQSRAVNLAGIEMLGVALATICLALFGHHIDWRRITLTGLVISIVGNIGSMALLHGVGFDTARFIAGLGEGIIISISFTFVGLTERADRNIALYLVSLLCYGAFGLWILPSFLNSLGLGEMFLAFAILTVAGLGTLRFLPRSAAARTEHNPLARQLGKAMLGIALLGTLAYNLAIGIAWAILFLVGVGAGHSEQAVANALFVSQLTAVGGALASVFLAERLGRWASIAGGILVGAACITILLGKPSLAIFTLGVCGFNFLWNFVLPFILGAVGDFDMKGRMMSAAIATQMMGLGAGPLIAGALIGNGAYRSSELLSVALLVISYGLLTIAMLDHRRKLSLSSPQVS